MMRTTILLLILPLAGCFQVDLTPGKFRCDQPGATCPMGQACVSGLCQDRHDSPEVKPDLAPAAGADAAGLAAAGCTGPGSRLVEAGGAEIYACQGRFSSGQFGALCRAGFHVCSAADEAAFSALELEGRCIGMRGFFAAQVEGAFAADGTLQCRAAGPEPERALLLGCGRERVAAGDGMVTVTQTVETSCRQLRTALPCNAGGPGWTCTGRLQDAAHSDEAKGGVLCCKG